ncbi:MAG TPA: hypothetical protein VJ732_03905 [Bryobacteraceae bacterium]|nr:hypothetical protein [Bryobacteraceae bacterium]
MRRIFWAPACVFTLMLAGAALGTAQNNNSNNQSNEHKTASQNSQEVNQNNKTATNQKTTKTSTDTVYGQIQSYNENKSITVSTPGNTGNSKTFDLNGSDVTTKVAGNLKVGDWVRVRERTDNNGHKMITVTRSSEKHAARVKK